MKPGEIKQLVGNTPHMSLAQAIRMTDFIHQHGIRDILELGFSRGVSTCYMCAALEESGDGSLVTIDLEVARTHVPNIEGLLAKCGYSDRVTRYYEPTSYTWRLMKFLEENPTPRFDLCYIDGAHNWFVDGFAFFLVDRLLRVGGWLIFDDLDWTYDTSPALHGTDQVRRMPEDERRTPQVRKIYDLLVKTHPNYGNFRVAHGWGYAQKCSALSVRSVEARKETVYVGLGDVVSRFGRSSAGQYLLHIKNAMTIKRLRGH
jgi:predicted O-methyltransferase YrrM